MTYDADVIAEWDAAARSRRRQAHIHPTGLLSEDAYDQSGQVAAVHLARLFGAHKVRVEHGARILDYGCGDGRVALPLARLGAEVVGCDASDAMLSALAARPDNDRLTCDQVHFESDVFHPDGHRLVPGWPLSSLRGRPEFDGAYALAVLIHQRWDAAAKIVRDLAAEVRSGGVLILDLPCYEDESEGGSAFGVTTFSPERIASMVEVAGLVLASPTVVNPGRFGGKPAPNHGAWTIAKIA